MNKISIIINNNSRNAESAATYLQALDESKIPYQLYKISPQSLDETINQCMTDSTMIIIGGGDGSIRSLAEHCVNKSIIMGVLPIGTMNHFSKELNLPTTPEEIVQAILQQKIVNIDVGSVNNKIFINNASIGFYSRLTKDRKYYSNFINKWLSYIPSFFSAIKNCKAYHFEIKTLDRKEIIKTIFVMISNNPYEFKLPGLFQRESFNNNELGLYYTSHEKFSLHKLINYFKIKDIKFNTTKVDSKFLLTALNHSTIRIALDGDNFIMTSPLTFESLPKSLQVLTL